MIRVGFIFLSFFLTMNASIINFEEEKYISAIDNTFYRKGTLEFKEKTIILRYNNSNRILIYKDDTLILKNKNEIQKINLDEQLLLKMVFVLIESIHNNDLESLEEFFTISKKTITVLKPKEILKSYIEKVEFKNQKSLEFITIYMRNQNRTTIRQIDD